MSGFNVAQRVQFGIIMMDSIGVKAVVWTANEILIRFAFDAMGTVAAAQRVGLDESNFRSKLGILFAGHVVVPKDCFVHAIYFFMATCSRGNKISAAVER